MREKKIEVHIHTTPKRGWIDGFIILYLSLHKTQQLAANLSGWQWSLIDLITTNVSRLIALIEKGHILLE